jgi:hypothetical protein
MPLFTHVRRSPLLGIVAIALLQLLVLFAIGAAVIRYLEWSSDAAQAEFMRAIEAVSDPNHSGESLDSIPRVKGRSGCDRKG